MRWYKCIPIGLIRAFLNIYMCICTNKKLCTKMFITKHIYCLVQLQRKTFILANKNKVIFYNKPFEVPLSNYFLSGHPFDSYIFNLLPSGPIYSSHHSDLCVPKFFEVGFSRMSPTQNDIPFPTWGWNVSCTRIDGCLSDNAQNIKRIWETNEGKY